MNRLDVDVEIHEDRLTTLRELEAGDHYISVSHFRNWSSDNIHHTIRVRTEDPFKSLTYLGSKITSFPSTRVFPVSIHQRVHT